MNGLIIKCDRCDQKLTELGALLFSPPFDGTYVKKVHLCKNCYNDIYIEIVNYHKEE